MKFRRELARGYRAVFLPKREGCVVAGLLLLAAAPGWRLLDRGWGPYDNTVEFSGGRNPEEFGFLPRLDIVEHAVYNPERTGFDSIRLITNDQGQYYHKLTHAQAYATVRKGWKLETTMKAVEGAGSVDLDSTLAGRPRGCWWTGWSVSGTTAATVNISRGGA